MSKNAVILQFPSGRRVEGGPPDEEPARPTRRWRRWIGGLLAVATVVGTAIGALDRSTDGATSPPSALVLSRVLRVRAVEDFCRAHPGGLFRARIHGVFYSGIALQNETGSLFDTGPIPPQVAIHPEYYAQSRRYARVVVVPWPRHERQIPAMTWVTVSGILSCTNPVQLEYLSYRDAAP